MYLKIILTKNEQLANTTSINRFCEYISTKLYEASKYMLLRNFDLENIWDKYLEDLYKDKEVTPTVSTILESYFSNLRWFEQNSSYVITVSNQTKINGVMETVDKLSRIINFGTLDMPKYTIFDDIYDFVADNLDKYYNVWKGVVDVGKFI